MSVFSQAAEDHWILIARRLTARDREMFALLLNALAEGAREAGHEWSAEDLERLAKLTRGEFA